MIDAETLEQQCITSIHNIHETKYDKVTFPENKWCTFLGNYKISWNVLKILELIKKIHHYLHVTISQMLKVWNQTKLF